MLIYSEGERRDGVVPGLGFGSFRLPPSAFRLPPSRGYHQARPHKTPPRADSYQIIDSTLPDRLSASLPRVASTSPPTTPHARVSGLAANRSEGRESKCGDWVRASSTSG